MTENTVGTVAEQVMSSSALKNIASQDALYCAKLNGRANLTSKDYALANRLLVDTLPNLDTAGSSSPRVVSTRNTFTSTAAQNKRELATSSLTCEPPTYLRPRKKQSRTTV